GGLMGCAVELSDDGVGVSISQWDWMMSSLAALRVLMPAGGLDLSAEPRVLLVAAEATDGARRLAASISRPDIELIRATPIAAGDRRGVLIEPFPALLAAAAGPPPGAAPPAPVPP